MVNWTFPTLERPSVFIGSPGDVDYLREGARREFYKLRDEVADIHGVELYLWEDEHFEQGFDHNKPYQGSIPLTSDKNCRAVIFLFGERIGSELPPDFPKDKLADTRAMDPHTAHSLIHPWPESAPDKSFPLTGSTFEYLVAESGQTPRLVLFFGDNSLHTDDNVFDQHWGLDRYLKIEAERRPYSERRRWEDHEGIPQRTHLRNFFRYIKQDRTLPLEIVSSEDEAREKIRKFLIEKLDLGKRAGRSSPFKGLAAFDVADNDVFFGRNTLRDEIVEVIQNRVENCKQDQRPFFRIFGTSGAGKSSLLRAGVVGRLCHRLSLGNWIDYIARPGDLAIAATRYGEPDALVPLYADSLARITNNVAAHETALRELSDVKSERRADWVVRELIEALDARPGMERKGLWRLILGIDQFEECLDQLTKPERAGFWENFIAFLDKATLTGRIAVATTVPISRLSQMSQHQTLKELSRVGVQKEVGFPDETIEQIIDKSFAEAGLGLMPDLRQKLLDAINPLHAKALGEEQGAALPLLSLAMTRIYERWEEKTKERREEQEIRKAVKLTRIKRDKDGGVTNLTEDFTAGARPTNDNQKKETPDSAQKQATEETRDLLSLEGYVDLTELKSIINREADAAISEAREAARSQFIDDETIPNLLRSLRRFMPRDPDNFNLLTIAPPRDLGVRLLADALRRHRLIAENKDGSLRLVHETILLNWTVAATWVDKERRRLDYIRGLDRAIKVWEKSDRDPAATAHLGTYDIERAGEVLYAWATTLSPVVPEEDVDEKHAQLRDFLIAILEYLSTPGERITELESGPTHFHAVVAANATDLVEKFLADDPTNARLTRTKDQRTPLFEAAFYNRREILEKLLKAGAPANAADNEGWLPLHAAATRGNVHAIEALAPYVKEINTPGGPGYVTALHSASANGHIAAMRFLLDHGAQVDPKDKENWAPLHNAAFDGHDEATGLLLERGAVIDTRLNYDWTALHLATQEGHKKVVNILLDKGAAVDARLSNGWTPLHLTALRGRGRVALRLIKKGAQVNARASNDWRPDDQRNNDRTNKDWINKEWTPLHVAADNGRDAVVRLLLKRRADANARTDRGRTPLHIAAEKGYKSVVQLLLNHDDTETDARDQENQTPLHLALRGSHYLVAQVLISSGAQVDAPQTEHQQITLEQDWKPLHFASREGEERLADLLLSNNADPNARTKEGWSPLHLAAENGREQVARVLIAYDAQTDAPANNLLTPLHLAAMAGHTSLVALLITHKVAVNVADESGMTPLHLAAEYGHAIIAELLINHGAVVDSRDTSAWTPLHLAAQNGHDDVVRVLLAHGADHEAISAKPHLTPLQAAAEVGQEAVVITLIEHGANIHAETQDKAQPLVLAVKNAQYATALRLLDADADTGAVDVGTGTTIAELFSANRARRTSVGDPIGISEAALGRRLRDAAMLPDEIVVLLDELAAGQIEGAPLDEGLRAVLRSQFQQSLNRERASSLNVSSRGFANINDYPWQPLSRDVRAPLIESLNPIDWKYEATPADTQVWWSTLPWHKSVVLVRLRDPKWEPKNLFIYYLMHEAQLYRLNGTSPPIHEVNAKASIDLNERNVLDYLRFFCFFVRGEEGPFYIAESLDDPMIPKHTDSLSAIEGIIRPATFEGLNAEGHFLCNAVVYYSNNLFIADFAVQRTGLVEMLSDEPVAGDLPVKVDAPIT